jgi:oligosaccharyltransferase complex subunit alpha (ribophorin I)
MDTIGRTALVLEARNLVDDVRDREIIVTYDYPLLAGLRKPLVISGSIASLFVAVWLVGSLNTGISAKRVKA